MNGIQIRRVTEGEWPAVLDVSRLTFGEEETPEDAVAFKLIFPFERSLGAFERGRLVGITTVLPLQLTVPGGASVPMGGLSWVGVLPTHRRRGILRALMTGQFADMLERGEIVSGLGASEATIYGRYGYGPAASAITFEVERCYSQFRSGENPDGAPGAEPGGRMTLLGHEEAATELPPLYERLRLMHPGQTDRPGWWWQAHLLDPPHNRMAAGRLYHVRHENAAGITDGYAAYRLLEKWTGMIGSLEVRVVELLAVDRQAYGALWRYLLDTDLSGTIGCDRGRVDEPLRWLLADARRFNVTALYDNLWLRLLDARRALGARAYRRPGRLVLEIADPFPSPRLLNLELRVDHPGEPGADCGDTTDAPDLALDVDALGMVYLGGASFFHLAAAGRVRELRPGAVELADSIFATDMAPLCCTEF